MSQALPGTHLCKRHQGNHSHYAQENCIVCKMAAMINVLLAYEGAEGIDQPVKAKAEALLKEAGHAST